MEFLKDKYAFVNEVMPSLYLAFLTKKCHFSCLSEGLSHCLNVNNFKIEFISKGVSISTVTAVALTVQIDVLGLGLGASPWNLPWGDHP